MSTIIQQCTSGHCYLGSANPVCPWCEIDLLRERVNDLKSGVEEANRRWVEAQDRADKYLQAYEGARCGQLKAEAVNG